jgi:3'(2'), 5'-bisphosphate nucleotidase
MNFNKEMYTARDLAIEAGKAIMEIYNTDFEVTYKEDQSPLTRADLAADEIIRKGLEKHFPMHDILSEEGETETERFDNDYVWIIDPVDGTREFVKKNGHFTVNIALTYKEKPVVGVVFAPVFDKLYYAAYKKGSYLTEGGTTKRIHVSAKTSNLILVGSNTHAHKEGSLMEQHPERISIYRKIGSSLKGCLVAEGAVDIYYRFGPTNEWDICAMVCVLEQAGGYFRDTNHEIITYNRNNHLNEIGFYAINTKANILI